MKKILFLLIFIIMFASFIYADRTQYYYDGTYYISDGTETVGHQALNGVNVTNTLTINNGGWTMESGTPFYSTDKNYTGNFSIKLTNGDIHSYNVADNATFDGVIVWYVWHTTNTPYTNLFFMGDDRFGLYSAISTANWMYMEDGGVQQTCDLNTITPASTANKWVQVMLNYTKGVNITGYVNGIPCHTWTGEGGIDNLRWVTETNGADYFYMDNIYMYPSDKLPTAIFIPPTPVDNAYNNTNVILNVSCNEGTAQIYYDTIDGNTLVHIGSTFANWTTNATSSGKYYYKGACNISGDLSYSEIRTWNFFGMDEITIKNSSINYTTEGGQLCGYNGSGYYPCGPTSYTKLNFKASSWGNASWRLYHVVNNVFSNYSNLLNGGFNYTNCSVINSDLSCNVNWKMPTGNNTLAFTGKSLFYESNDYNLLYTNIFNVTVLSDIINPNISFNPGTNFHNNSIISSGFYNLTFNFTVADINLFQVAINLTCSINGTIYYWEKLDINITSYTIADKVNFTTNYYPPQKCEFLISSSDDHTEKEFIYNTLEEKSDSLEINAKDINLELIDVNKNVADIKTSSKIDRINMDITFLTKELEQTLQFKTDKEIYPRLKSKYPGHLVIWDSATKKGLWSDLNEGDDITRDYEIKKKDKNIYNIKIKSKVPENEIDGISLAEAKNLKELKEKYGMKTLSLHSIGGTNVVNLSTIFYIGSVLNTSAYNMYDNTLFNGYCVNISTIYATPEYNTTVCFTGSQGYIVNLTNGTYLFKFNSSDFFDKNYTFTVNESIYAIAYNTSQSIINIRVKSTSGNTYLTNVNYTIYNQLSTKRDSIYETTNLTTFFINTTNYNLTINKPNYLIFNTNFSVDKRENKTIEFNLSYLAGFVLLDEKTLGQFDINGTNSTKFLLFCSNGNIYTTIINTTTLSLPIDCVFDKFEFVLDYGSLGSYYRVLKYDADEIFNNKSIYLIDIRNTAYVVNSFITEDLFSTYENTAIYIKRIINSSTVQITADEVDIENKLTAYLIANYEYILEIHSSNQPTRIIGSYIAAFSGTKNIRLYDFSLNPVPSDISVNTTIDIGKITYVGANKVLTASYNDSMNQTYGVTYKIYNNNMSGVLLNTMSTIDQNVEFSYVVPDAYKHSTLISTMNVSHLKGNYLYGAYIQINNTKIDNLATRDDFIVNIGSGDTTEEKIVDGKKKLNFFITMLLLFLSLTFTIKTKEIGALFLSGIAVFLSIFKFFTVSWFLLLVTLIIAFIAFIKKQGDE